MKGYISSRYAIFLLGLFWLFNVSGCSYPEPQLETDQNQVEQILTELREVKAQLNTLESRLQALESGEDVSTQEESHESSTDDLTLEERIDWLDDYTSQYENLDMYSQNDPQVAVIAERFEDNLEALIEFNIRSPWQPYVIETIRVLLTPENEYLILENMDVHDEYVDLAYERGMHATHPSYFSSALETRINKRTDYIPTGLIDFAADNEMERFRENLEDYAVNGSNIHMTFEALASAGYDDLAGLSEKTFERLGMGDSWEDIHRAFVAAKYAGSADALSEFLDICLNLPEEEREYSNCETKSLIRHSGSLEEIHQDLNLLIYKNSGNYWHLPS